jgi:Leucine-rich repeat (LRR) protein
MEYTLYGKLYSTDITKLDLSNKDLKYIDPNIKYFINLQKLYLYCNEIKEIPKEICNLTQLQKLDLSSNEITKLSHEIGYLTQLQELDLSCNKIKEISKEIGNLTQLQKLDLYCNKIKEFPKEICHLTQLQEFFFYHNQIKELPLEIINLRNIIYFYYYENPIENLLNPIIYRFIQRIGNRGGNIHNLYNDTQNVHSSSIQQSIKDSIYNLMKEVKDNNKINYLDDSILSVQTKEALVEYSKDKNIHTQLNCTFEEVLQAVLLEINKLPTDLQIEVKNRLNEEMEDGLCKCFTGRLSRLVNSLSGYSDKVSIKISSAEEIGNVISIMKDRYGDDTDKVRINVEKELLERGYEKKIIDEWITYL